jgi:serpin B
VGFWLISFYVFVKLCENFRNLQCRVPFDTDKADFSEISASAKLSISKVVHQTFINLDETGTEAAAATAAFVMVGCCLHREEPYEFICNRPFLFIIHEKNHNGVLFMGKYVCP